MASQAVPLNPKLTKIPSLEEIRQRVDKQAQTKIEIESANPAKKDEVSPAYGFVNKDIKEMAYRRSVRLAAQQLPPLSRLFSKTIHLGFIDSLSELAAGSLGRSSGILGGGLVAFFGGLVYYYLTKSYGYEYNFLVFIMLLGLGFAAGWILEFLRYLGRGANNS